MADLEKQPQTTGPRVPPGRRAGSKCCCRSCLSLLLKITATIAVVLGLAILIFVIVVNPQKMKFHVTDASLTEFNLTGTALRYDLRLNVTVRNPNKKIGIHYEVSEADAYYEGEKLGTGNLLSFYQPPKTTSVVDAWFRGVRRLSLRSDEVEEFKEKQISSGVYSVGVKIRYYSSIKLGKMHIGDFKVKIKCRLKVPLISSGNMIRYSEWIPMAGSDNRFSNERKLQELRNKEGSRENKKEKERN